MTPLTSPSVNGVSFQGTFSPTVIAPFSDPLPLTLPFNFKNVANLVVTTGTFTPNNNEQYIFNELSEETAPNFLIILCDAQMNITAAGNAGDANQFVDYLPIMKFFFHMFPNGVSFWTSLLIDGRAADPNPMPQGTPVNYTIIYGQAVVS